MKKESDQIEAEKEIEFFRNIRMARTDIDHLKRKAAEEGLPYQTLIASVLHKYVTGRLQPVGTGKC